MKIKRQTVLNVLDGLGFEASFREHALHPNAVRVVVEELNIGTTTRRTAPRIDTVKAQMACNFVNSIVHYELEDGRLIL